MKLYHGTIRENLESILNYGLRPYPIWDSGKVPVVCLTDSPKHALLQTYSMDISKVEIGEKKKPANGYVVFEVSAKNYKVGRWEVGEWWVRKRIKPEDIKVVIDVDYKAAKRIF